MKRGIEGEEITKARYIGAWEWAAAAYAAAVLALGFWVSSEPGSPPGAKWLLWIAAYLPLVVFPLAAGWRPKTLGLVLDPWLAVVAAALLLLLSVYLGRDLPPVRDWSPWLDEAFARTGEELFFRGFLFALILRLSARSPRGRVWALLGTSLLFTLAHIPQYGLQPIAPLVVIFASGLVLGLLRIGTQSVLPGIMLHTVLNAGIPGMVIGTGIYFIVVAASGSWRQEPRISTEK